jgi:hypothetical protein
MTTTTLEHLFYHVQFEDSNVGRFLVEIYGGYKDEAKKGDDVTDSDIADDVFNGAASTWRLTSGCAQEGKAE